MKQPERPLPPPPTFLIIGAQKSATRWLRSNLGKHPDVFTADHELSFFNRPGMMRRIGLEGYRAQFDGWEGEPVVGEATPGYMIHRHDPNAVSRRINRALPDVRLIAILRNPIDRANSALLHHIRRRRLPARTKLVKVVKKRNPETDRLSLIAGGWYGASLKPYKRRFGERLLIMLYDDLERNSLAVYQRALRHVGAEPSFVPEGLESVVFSNKKSDDDRDDLTLKERRILYGYFRDDIRRLQRMMGRSLRMWDPDYEAPTPPTEPLVSAPQGATEPGA
jgi:hypothetical protein